MSIQTPINNAILQSDLDVAGFNLLNFSGGGLPAGGTAGQFLQKQSSTDGDADWATVAGGDENTVTAADIGLLGDGVTDNSVALQTWLDSVNLAKVNSTLLVPDGVYIFSGSLQNTGYQNAQILLPTANITDPAYSVTIKGYHPISYVLGLTQQCRCQKVQYFAAPSELVAARNRHSLAERLPAVARSTRV